MGENSGCTKDNAKMRKAIFVGISIFSYIFAFSVIYWLLPENAVLLQPLKRFAYIYSGFFSIMIFIDETNLLLPIIFESIVRLSIIFGVSIAAKKKPLIAYSILASSIIYAGISTFFGATLIVAMLQ